jgi:2-C-methyl-D-erythritol 4-phosphate cytidylyltransferase/2-C-methyl-D-erythritol 2,4-cyclodiphosphate synthase
MKKAKDYHVIIAAAGSGERFGGGSTPKQYLELAGKPVLRHSIDTFIAQIGYAPQIAINAFHSSHYVKSVVGLNLPAPIHGSDTRKASVYTALKKIPHASDDDIVIIHDAARPNISKQAIQDLLEAMEGNEAASLAVPVSDTLRRGADIVDRTGLWALQTPQAFRYGILKKAHETVKGEFTDDTGLVSALGIEVKLVRGSNSNIKITTPEDFEMLEKLMAKTGETRTGMGFDVHAFSKDKARKLVLCGLQIDHPFGLEGHSDADVGLHALTDAILGSIGEGDIGLHFPPSDATFKNMDSRIFLEKACDMLRDKGGIIQNADITIICEQPKITPHRDAMQIKIAEILGIEKSRVNVKATTTEGLGFTGRGEGIAAQAIVTVKL